MTTVRLLVTAVLFGSVLWAGTAHPPATAVLAAVSAVLLGVVIWDGIQSGRAARVPPLALVLGALTVVALAQLVPLPEAVRALLSPAEERVRAQVLAGLPHARWRPMTADVAATLTEAMKLAGLTAFAIVAARLSGEHHRRLLRGALLGATVALLSVAALGAAGVKLPPPLYPTVPPRSLLTFPLVNPNHAGSLLVLTLPILLALAARRSGPVRWALIALTVACNLGLAATGSRAAVLLGALAQGVVLVLIERSGRGERSRLVQAGILGVAVMLVAAVPLLWTRLATPSAPGRLALWRDSLSLLRDHLLLGAGTGAFPFVITRYSPMAAKLRYGFVENEYLQLLVDGGLVAVVLVGAAVWLAVREVRRASAEQDDSLGMRAAQIGLAALALHNAVDFSFAIGAVAAAACVAAALAFPRAGRRLRLGTGVAWIALSLSLVALSFTSLGSPGEADGAALRSLPATTGFAIDAEATRLFGRHPADAFIADVAADRLLGQGDAARAVPWLDRALTDAPHDPVAHRLTARVLAGMGLRDSAALELRAAMAEANDVDRVGVCDEIAAILSHDDDGPRLIVAVGPAPRDVHDILRRLALQKQWNLVEALGAYALGSLPNDAETLGHLVTAGLERQDRSQLAERARRWAASDPSPYTVQRAAHALEVAGAPGEAEELLVRSLGQLPPSGASELAVRLAELALARGDTARAAAVLDDALARAVEPADKIRVHLERARVEEKLGHEHRAERERAEAARLSSH
jgi:tetratricopeptide (TPR) repeat protein